LIGVGTDEFGAPNFTGQKKTKIDVLVKHREAAFDSQVEMMSMFDFEDRMTQPPETRYNSSSHKTGRTKNQHCKRIFGCADLLRLLGSDLVGYLHLLGK
jgi:hypothetical protein